MRVHSDRLAGAVVDEFFLGRHSEAGMSRCIVNPGSISERRLTCALLDVLAVAPPERCRDPDQDEGCQYKKKRRLREPRDRGDARSQDDPHEADTPGRYVDTGRKGAQCKINIGCRATLV
jgi:hypothetical protein